MKLGDWFSAQYNGNRNDEVRKGRWQQRIAMKNIALYRELGFSLGATNRNALNKSKRILNREAVTLLP